MFYNKNNYETNKQLIKKIEYVNQNANRQISSKQARYKNICGVYLKFNEIMRRKQKIIQLLQKINKLKETHWGRQKLQR